MDRPDKIDIAKRMQAALQRKQIALEAAFHISANPTPRSPRHGRNRISTPQAHRDPARRAGARDDRADLAAYTSLPGAITYISAADWAAACAGAFDIADLILQMKADLQPKPAPQIPYAGVTVGEIVGYRAWLVVPHNVRTYDWDKPANVIDSAAYEDRSTWRLRSLASDFIWPPGEVIRGDTGKVVKEWFRASDWSMQQIWGGVYAFRSPGLDQDTHERIAAIRSGWLDDCLAIGTCTLWGDVVEHEHGYRASHARLRSIDAVYGGADLAELRREYRLEGQQ